MAFLAHRQSFTWLTGVLVNWAATRASDSIDTGMPVMDAPRDHEREGDGLMCGPRNNALRRRADCGTATAVSDVTQRPSCSTKHQKKHCEKAPSCYRILSPKRTEHPSDSVGNPPGTPLGRSRLTSLNLNYSFVQIIDHDTRPCLPHCSAPTPEG
jgi:hypothetical protein